MNITLWIFQVLLALHTAIGAVWKLSNSEQTVPSLQAIPHGVWIGASAVEFLCSVGLVLPFFYKPLAFLIPSAAIVIAAEMLIFCGLHLTSGDKGVGPLAYWLGVMAVCVFIAYGRLARAPL